MRGLVDGLASPHPLLGVLPALYAEDDVAGRLTAAFDEVLAPVFVVLDNFAAYLDPATAPEDFLAVLGGWVAAVDDPSLPLACRRELVARAVELHRWRGTAGSLVAAVALVCGVAPEVDDGGGATWSAEPGGEPPGRAGGAAAGIVVRLRVPDPAAVDARLVNLVVESLRPAHLPARVEIVPAGDGAEGSSR